jgi:tetratricopeptide (TPR) repeat protein
VTRALALAAVLLGLGLSGCATAPSASPGRLAAEHQQRALTYERRGDLRSALEEWKIALTIDPDSVAARAGHARLRRLLQTAVARRIRLGRHALAQGRHGQARRHLLAALAFDPTNAAAFKALREVPELHFTIHLVVHGDTLGAIAERYYGDPALAEVIWEANRLPPRRKLTVGMRLKIPEVSGLRSRLARPRKVALPTRREDRTEEPVLESNPLLLDAREAFERQEYPAALAAVDRLLEGQPANTEWLELKKAILYRQGRADLANGLYDDAHRALAQLVRLDPGYRDGAGLLSEARSHAIQLHYNEGIRLSREEQLEAAIAHWHAVLEHDPQHAEARRNIEQAERILRVLEEAAKP